MSICAVESTVKAAFSTIVKVATRLPAEKVGLLTVMVPASALPFVSVALRAALVRVAGRIGSEKVATTVTEILPLASRVLVPPVTTLEP
jgi:hypothetical protein